MSQEFQSARALVFFLFSLLGVIGILSSTERLLKAGQLLQQKQNIVGVLDWIVRQPLRAVVGVHSRNRCAVLVLVVGCELSTAAHFVL